MAKKVVKNKFKQKAKQRLNHAKKKFKNAEAKIHAYMSKHPEKSALIAAALGSGITLGVEAALKKLKNR